MESFHPGVKDKLGETMRVEAIQLIRHPANDPARLSAFLNAKVLEQHRTGLFRGKLMRSRAGKHLENVPLPQEKPFALNISKE
ncbi:MAG TPA: hypothetical protein VGO67_13610 [Verrucomicrobiae bacterium]